MKDCCELFDLDGDVEVGCKICLNLKAPSYPKDLERILPNFSII